MKSKKLYINGKIGEREQLAALLGGEAPSFSAQDCRQFIQNHLDADEFVVEISSDGGSTSEGFEIYDLLRSCPQKITTIAYKANSIASVILLAGDERWISPSGGGYIHNAWMSPTALAHVQLNAIELERLQKECLQMDERILNLYCSVVGEQKRNDLQNLMQQEQFLDAPKMVELGFAQGIYQPQATVNIAIPDIILNHLHTMNKPNDKRFWKRAHDWFHSIERKLDQAIAPRGFFNLIETQTEEGQSLVIEAEEGEDWVGKALLIIDESGERHPAPKGDYTLEDGTALSTDEQGLITAVSPIKEDKEELEKEVQNLRAQKADLQQSLKEAQQLNAETQKALLNLKKEVQRFKEAVPGEAKGNARIPQEQPDSVRSAVLNYVKNGFTFN